MSEHGARQKPATRAARPASLQPVSPTMRNLELCPGLARSTCCWQYVPHFSRWQPEQEGAAGLVRVCANGGGRLIFSAPGKPAGGGTIPGSAQVEADVSLTTRIGPHSDHVGPECDRTWILSLRSELTHGTEVASFLSECYRVLYHLKDGASTTSRDRLCRRSWRRRHVAPDVPH
jgi:hypothetical protein